MSNTFRRLAVWAAGLPLLLSCGGGEVLSILGYIPAAGGQYSINDNAAGGFTERRCFSTALGSDDRCGLSLAPTQNTAGNADTEALYASRYSVTASGQLRDDDSACANLTGTVDGPLLSLGSCFTGRFENPNKVVATDGSGITLVVDFFPRMADGVWVDIHDRTRRFKFDNNASGCELSAAGERQVDLNITASDVTNSNGFGVIAETVMAAFTVQRVGGPETWSGRFVGASGLRLTRNGQTLEIERRRDTTTVCTV